MSPMVPTKNPTPPPLRKPAAHVDDDLPEVHGAPGPIVGAMLQEEADAKAAEQDSPEKEAPRKHAAPPEAVNLVELLQRRNVVKEFEVMPGLMIRFRTTSIFEYYLYLKWTSSKNFAKYQTKDRLDFETTLHSLALYFHSFADERAHPLAGQDFYAEYSAGRRRFLESPEPSAIDSAAAADARAAIPESPLLAGEAVEDYTAEDRFNRFETKLYESFFDMLDHNYAALGTLSEAALSMISRKFQEFIRSYVDIRYDRDYHADMFKDLDLAKIVFNINTQCPVSIYDGKVRATFVTLPLRAKSALESWIDDFVSRVDLNEMAMSEFNHIRGIRHLAARIVNFNGKVVGNPTLAKKSLASMTEEEMKDLFESRVVQLYGLPYCVIYILQEAFKHMDDAISQKANWGDVKN